jgi:vacuolar-type H+-ATPase subunit F/Vma7
MRVKVIKPFRDKHTKVVYVKGEEIEVTDDRFKEINSTKVGELVVAVGDMQSKSTAVKTTKKSNRTAKK